MTAATTPYLNQPVRALEELVIGRRVAVALGGPADARELGTIAAAIPGQWLVRFANRSEWVRPEHTEFAA